MTDMHGAPFGVHMSAPTSGLAQKSVALLFTPPFFLPIESLALELHSTAGPCAFHPAAPRALHSAAPRSLHPVGPRALRRQPLQDPGLSEVGLLMSKVTLRSQAAAPMRKRPKIRPCSTSISLSACSGRCGRRGTRRGCYVDFLVYLLLRALGRKRSSPRLRFAVGRRPDVPGRIACNGAHDAMVVELSACALELSIPPPLEIHSTAAPSSSTPPLAGGHRNTSGLFC